MKFWSMLIAFMFGSIGYYMLIFLSGIERIPGDLYEAATIDGANKVQQFTDLTVPLLKSVIKTNVTFWSVNTITFFLVVSRCSRRSVQKARRLFRLFTCMILFLEQRALLQETPAAVPQLA